MAVIRRNFLTGNTSVLLSAGGTTLTSADLAALPVVAAPDYAWLSLDPLEEHGLPEIVKVTAHSSGAVSATIVRGEQQAEGGVAGREHPSGTHWSHATTALDLSDIEDALAEASYVLNVRTFGATGDGVTDDYPAIQAALTAAGLATDGTAIAYIPAGTYQMSARANVPANVTVMGVGWRSILRATAANATGLLQMVGLSNVTVRDLAVDGAGFAAIPIGTALASATDVAVNHTVERVRFTGSTNDCCRVSNPVLDYRFVDNTIDSVVGGFSIQAGVTPSSGIEISGNTVRNVTGSDRVGLQVYGATQRYTNVQVRGNKLETGAGSIPIEVTGCTNVAVTDNTMEAATRGASVGTCTDVLVAGNVMRDQSIYAVESNTNNHMSVVDNVAIDCASLIHETGSTTTADLVVADNTYIGSGLSSAVAGNAVIKLRNLDGVKVTGNYIRGAQYVNNMVLVGVAVNAADNVEVADNTVIVDTANAGLAVVNVDLSVDCTVKDNKVVVTRNLVVGDDNTRVMSAKMGSVTGVAFLRNEIVFKGTVASAPNAIGVGSNFAGAGTLPRSSMIGNRVVNGPIGFVWNCTSADALVYDNEGRTCATEYSTLDAALIFRRTRREFEGSAAPTVGTWTAGDRVWNIAPVALGVPGWVCTGGGTPGVWREMPYLL